MRYPLLLTTALAAASAISTAHTSHVHIAITHRSRSHHAAHVHPHASATAFRASSDDDELSELDDASSRADSSSNNSSSSNSSVATVELPMPSTNVSTCTLAPNTLSLACNNACAPFSPCLRIDSGARPSATATRVTAAATCPYECFQVNSTTPQSYETFQFLVPFSSAYKSPQELAGTFTPEALTAWNDTKALPSESNALLQRVEPLVLPNTTETVKLQGGSTLDTQVTRGRVANVALAPTLVTNQSSVLSVSLANLRLEQYTDTLVTMVPPTVVVLVLNNGLLTRLPTGLATLTKLKTLNVNRNYITTIPSTAAKELKALTAFGANTNGLKSFDAVFANLSLLDLTTNNLTAMPAVLANYTNLKKLHISGNQITAVDKTAAIKTLTELYIYDNRISRFDALFPSLTTLSLTGNNLAAIPPVVFNHTKLRQLYIGRNRITAVEKTDAIKTLTELYIYDNRISRFDALFPSLTTLSLMRNNLAAIPPVVFNHTKLRQLYLHGNPLTNVTVTSAQAKFLTSLTNLTLDAPSATAAATCTTPQVIHNVTFCVTDSVTLAPTLSPKSTPAVAATNSSTPSPASAINNKQSNGTSGTSVAAIATTVGVTLLLLAAIAAVYYRKTSALQSRASDASSVTGVSSPLAHVSAQAARPIRTSRPKSSNGSSNNSAAVSVWDDPALLAMQVPVDDITDVRRLGDGAYGDVWLVKLRLRANETAARIPDAIRSGAKHNTVLLASKRLKQLVDPSERDANRARTQAFISEIKLVSTLSHAKIVAFVGAAWTVESDLQALFEYMGGGDLRAVLEDPRTPRAWSLRKIQLALDVAEALAFCHALEPALVHRDLKSRNVLLTADGASAKLADFGIARFRSQANTMTSGVGTARWLAPEVITGDGDYGPAADVFSFGVVLSELDTHEFPYAAEMKRRELVEVALLQLVASGDVRPRIDASCPDAIAAVAAQCLARDPLERPRALEIAYELRVIKQQLE